MKRIIIGVIAAWAGIVALAWWLADRRIKLCDFEKACILPRTEVRDNVLIWGLTIPLFVFVALLTLGLRRWARLNRPSGLSTMSDVQRARR